MSIEGAKTFSAALLSLFLVALTTGCNLSSSSSNREPVGPDLHGDWSGEFYIMRAENPQRQEITATIEHRGDAVILKTSIVGIGANLTGTINADGEMLMYDALNDEDWTTYFEPATANRIRLVNFMSDPLLGAQSPLSVIDLRR